MARAMAAVLARLQQQPAFLFGHSAGAAVVGQMVVDRLVAPAGLVLLNPALLPPRGLQRVVFPLAARGLAGAPWFAPLVASRARRGGAVERLLESIGTRTGSDGIGADAVGAYRQLLSDRVHVTSVIRMMAEWDLEHLLPALARRHLPTLVISGARDGAVTPAEIRSLAARLPWAAFLELPGVGHLAQEEAPAEVARRIADWADGLGAGEPACLEAHG
jgi:magnesium chelatase accessory protein